MELKLYQVDAFSDRPFGGNPAAVVPLDAWLPDETLQAIAIENNLSETAYFVKDGADEGAYHLRWFTPGCEVNLCGHATLASAWVIFHMLGDTAEVLRFRTRSGELRVRREGDRLAMDFPAVRPLPCTPPKALLDALGLARADEILAAEDYFVVVPDEDTVMRLQPDMAALKGLPLRGVCVTAPGEAHDLVSRWFGPNVGVDEDPVTGSAHTSLTPYWTARLGKQRLTARQGGRRQGTLTVELTGDRVLILGSAALYLEGTIRI